MTVRTCERAKKRIFGTAAQAKKATAHWLSLANPEFEQTAQSVYRCQFCRKWHITSLAPEVTRELTQVKRARRRAQA